MSQPRRSPHRQLARSSELVSTPPKRRRSRSRGGAAKKSAAREPQHTSHPTTRAAYAETRRWLLKEHGPVCAYCAQTFPAREMTLDHVAPRKGQSAYDRRDNLVLACKGCNSAKADMPILAFLLRRRARAVSLAQYGVHLSPMLREMILEIADGVVGSGGAMEPADEESPYADVAYREPLRPYRDLTHEELKEAPVAHDDDGDDDPPARRRRRGGRRKR